MSDRPKRSCDECGKIDDHPRHIFAAGEATYRVNTDAVEAAYNDKTLSGTELVAIVTDLQDTTSLTRHMDCCRIAGCPTGDCNSVPELKGNALVEAITGEKVK
jgi:hypothetical protein